MRIVAACAVLLAFVSAAHAAAEPADADLMTKVLEYHFARTQPFYRHVAIVDDRTRPADPQDRPWMAEEVVKDQEAAQQVLAAVNGEKERLTVPNGVTDRYSVVDLKAFETSSGYDWKKIADQYPEAKVVFRISHPVFDSAHRFAVLRLDGHTLPAGHDITLLYALAPGRDGAWRVFNFIAPCCIRP